jgi:5-formyltetrahydrofolate cyclo-ligase
LIPGVAFTAACDRLGYGGGFYDGLLSRWDSRPLLVAAAFDVQIVDALPVNSNDQPVDHVVSETRSFRRIAPATDAR